MIKIKEFHEIMYNLEYIYNTNNRGEIMNEDTIKLLKECDSGSKMAVSSINDVLDKIKDKQFYDILKLSLEHHEVLGNKIHKLLNEYGYEDSDPSLMAKSMSWMQTNMKFMMDDSDHTIADIMTDGCNMGIKTLNKYLNQYKHADEKSKELCHELIKIEEELNKEMRVFL